ncbi:MAG: S-adenosylmethionine decarboxylase [Deltaproteobacteria bacterium]|nr:S-adenosylmethionine decarboxylase [Deltaproteobacteria bacterium]
MTGGMATPPMGPQLGLQGWFWAAPPAVALDAEGRGAALCALADALGLLRLGAPLAGPTPGGARGLSLLSASHCAWATGPGWSCFTVFSCAGHRAGALERGGAALLGPGVWRWAPRGPVGGAGPSWRPTLTGWRSCWAHPDPDALLELLRGGFAATDQRAHRFAPHGLTWAGLATDRALVLHTWPEHGLLTVDLDGEAPDALDAAAVGAGARPVVEAPDGPAA